MDIGDIFDEPIISDVFLVNPADDLASLSTIANERNFSIYRFDGSKFASKRAFFNDFAQVMKPPETFVDWDYFERQLETLEWLEKEVGEVIIYKDIEHFHSANRKDFDILLNIFLHVTDFRNKRLQLRPLLIFLQGDKTLDLHFPFKTVAM